MDAKLLDGLIVYSPNVFFDNRGYFYESYNKEKMLNLGIDANFVQDNESKSKVMTIRGLHWQAGEFAQAKLVRVIQGAVIDFVLDIRKSSPSFGKFEFVLLTGSNKIEFYVPRGFAHGFIALDNDTIFSYKCDNFYNKESERGINMLDPKLDLLNKIKHFMKNKMSYSIDVERVIISDKDRLHPNFEEAVDLF